MLPTSQGTAKDVSPADLAWGHDVVLTTFSRLSAEWSGDSGVASSLRQVSSISYDGNIKADFSARVT